MRLHSTIALALLIAAAPVAAGAQDMSPASDVTRFLLDTGLMLVAGLAGLLTLAGFALRDVGLARTQNAPAVCLRTIGLLAVAIFMFWATGYHLLYDVEPGGFLGEFKNWSLDDVDPSSAGVASGAFWFSQMVIAALGAAIVSASLSERVRLWPFLFFAAIWCGLIYPIVASWVWGGGYFGAEWNFRDLGGAGVLHASAGAAALAAVMVVGPRQGRYSHGPARQAPSTALPLSAFGVSLSIIGLIVVIAGLQGSFSSVESAVSIASIAVNVLTAVAAGSLAAMFLTQTVYKRTGLVSAMTGSIAGLVSIAADPLAPAMWQAAMIGAVGGFIVTITPPFLDRLRIDDAGFAIPAHCFCGAWGCFISFWPSGASKLSGQVVGTVAILGFSFFMSMLIWVALKYTVGVRSVPVEEQAE
ncbi:hypothetical protein PUV54_05905 [Hyphococcus flavus]|uniref:Ammonium transporter AmtB-like domain-containing protein n=1 Tax=Hyphococcus flavus TaxID=1866326 RepID=A0AAF0CGQ4_9PROT|nr:hypothetical protein [Hyphococcus flavus]WDI32729.1 hypothetical protein PUV54_05905 [Hyphococcus flavus]